jgi:hypothetical protein
MKYRTAFQCPDTGQTVIAHYAFGRVSITAADDDDEHELEAATVAWCKKYRGKRFRSFEAADEYIRRVSEGQTFGFESEA